MIITNGDLTDAYRSEPGRGEVTNDVMAALWVGVALGSAAGAVQAVVGLAEDLKSEGINRDRPLKADRQYASYLEEHAAHLTRDAERTKRETLQRLADNEAASDNQTAAASPSSRQSMRANHIYNMMRSGILDHAVSEIRAAIQDVDYGQHLDVRGVRRTLTVLDEQLTKLGAREGSQVPIEEIPAIPTDLAELVDLVLVQTEQLYRKAAVMDAAIRANPNFDGEFRARQILVESNPAKTLAHFRNVNRASAWAEGVDAKSTHTGDGDPANPYLATAEGDTQ